jgi:hypothetical protein
MAAAFDLLLLVARTRAAAASSAARRFGSRSSSAASSSDCDNSSAAIDGLHAVEAARVFQHGGVAGGARRPGYRQRGRSPRLRCFERQHLTQRAGETGLARIEPADRQVFHFGIVHDFFPRGSPVTARLRRARPSPFKCIENRRQPFALELERRLVDHQARRDLHDLLHLDQVVGAQRAAGADQIDDGVGQPTSGPVPSSRRA